MVPFNVEDADVGCIEAVKAPDLPEPVMPPVAPEALMRDWALFLLVQARIVPFDLTDGSAKHRWVAAQRPFEVSNWPFTQVAMAFLTHVVSPLLQEPEVVPFAL